MWIFDDFRRCGAGCVALLSVLTGCGTRESEAPTTSIQPSPIQPTSVQATSIQTTVPTTAETGQRLEKWIDLQVGDCLADPPPTDPGVVLVSIVDCAIPHAAEVYLRADLEVNAAIADVADRQCSAGLTKYSGQSIGPLAMTYLIDSNQDRTSTDPLPSTVICLLQAPNGGPLTGSARR